MNLKKLMTFEEFVEVFGECNTDEFNVEIVYNDLIWDFPIEYETIVFGRWHEIREIIEEDKDQWNENNLKNYTHKSDSCDHDGNDIYLHELWFKTDDPITKLETAVENLKKVNKSYMKKLYEIEKILHSSSTIGGAADSKSEGCRFKSYMALHKEISWSYK